MKLLKLEIAKISIRPYLIASGIIPIAALLFVYLITVITTRTVNVGMQAGMTTEMEVTTYAFLYKLSFMMNVAGFVCLCGTMLAKIVMEAYSERNVYLTLGYPILRQKLLHAKIGFCLLFCGVGVFIGTFLTNLLFFLLETLLRLVDDQLLLSEVFQQLPLLLIAVVLVMSIGLIALYIGWLKNSTALTVVSAVLLFSIPSNLMSAGSVELMAALALVLLFISIGILGLLKGKVNKLEV